MQDQYRAFHKDLRTYDIIPGSLNSLYSKRSTKVLDPAKQRELKINQYKQEKGFRSKINVCRDCLSYDCLTLILIHAGNQETAGTKTNPIPIHGL